MGQLMSRILREQNEFLTTLSTGFTSTLNQTFSQTDEPHIFARLPKLTVPTFSGDYKEFPSFRDMYIAAVHGNLGLNDVEKFQYLKGYLRGEAADLIRHIIVSDTNYKSAWDKICERYDKKRQVVNDFIRTFVDQPSVKVESVISLRRLHSTSDEVMRGITAVGGEATEKDPWLIYILLQKIDHETRQAWAHHTVGKDFPTFDELLKFISERCDALETCESRKPVINKTISVKTHQVQTEQVPYIQYGCSYCKAKDHRTFLCESFKGLNVDQRRLEATNLKLCFNCLSKNHLVSQCYSKGRCVKCNRRHHTLLHSETTTNISTLQEERENTIEEETNQASTTHEETGIVNNNVCSIGTAFLQTAVVHAKTNYGHQLKCNLLLDSGSQLSFVTEKCVNRLGIPRNNGRIRIEGIATSNVSTIGKVSFPIFSRFDEQKTITIKAYILPKITSLGPSARVSMDQFENLKIPLADPNFQSKKEIDILLGADYFFYVLGNMQHHLSTVVAQETLFGYVISRKPSTDVTQDEQQVLPLKNFNASLLSDESLESLLQKFWEQEEVVPSVPWSEEDQLCETHFLTNHKKIKGRFMVQLPIKPNSTPLGKSFNTALQRLLSMERKRNRNTEFGQMYIDFMREY